MKDRPYAATLVATLAAGTWLDGQRVRNEVRLGWMGPSVRGKSLQNAVHRVINAPRFQGWAHQLPDEPILEAAQYRVKRWQPATVRGTDLLGHWGMRLGNLQTSAFAGLEWRFGSDLQDDGGSAPLRPGSNEPWIALELSCVPQRWGTGMCWRISMSMVSAFYSDRKSVV